jgi:hypothetical protein
MMLGGCKNETNNNNNKKKRSDQSCKRFEHARRFVCLRAAASIAAAISARLNDKCAAASQASVLIRGAARTNIALSSGWLRKSQKRERMNEGKNGKKKKKLVSLLETISMQDACVFYIICGKPTRFV